MLGVDALRAGRTARSGLGHNLRRTTQSVRAFSNWPTVLSRLARRSNGASAQDLTFVTRSGLELRCPNRPGAPVPVFELLAEDCYRLGWFASPLVGRPVHALDVGAHVGAFSCLMTRLLPAVTIECIEPSPVTARYLRDNLSRNGVADRVTVSETALSAESGSSVMEDQGDASALNGLVRAGDTPSPTAVHVATRSFDDVVAESRHPIGFVKIDCEGAEYDLVLASRPESWKSVERIVLEYHSVAGHSWAELEGWFATTGLHVVRHEESAPDQGTVWLVRSPRAGR